MRILFDASALLKRYLPERGRDALMPLLAAAKPVMVAPHCRCEIYAALNRVRRDTQSPQDNYRLTCAEVERNFAEFDVIPMTSVLERAALRVLEAAPIRAADAMHIGAAIAASADLFVAADRRLCEGAAAVGLKTHWMGE